MQRFILRQNIARFRQMLAQESDETLLVRIRSLLAEAETDLAAIERVWTWSYPALGAQLGEALEELLEATVVQGRADFGNFQVWEEDTATLHLVAQRNLHKHFIENYAHVASGEGTVCDEARRKLARVIVDDIETNHDFAALRKIARTQGIRAIQSTPLKSSDGAFVGIFSTHYRRPHSFGEGELRFIDSLAARAGPMIAAHFARHLL